MALELRKAERRKTKARIGISGPAGSGKTMSALLMAYGLVGDWNKIAIIDTENGSGELYANYDRNGIVIGKYFTIPIQAPYTPEKYIEAIKLCEDNGIEVAIIDSFSHAWAGEGGLLDQHGKIADSGKNNSYTAWRTITPKHNQLVEKMNSSKIHTISTMRAKMEYVQEKGPDGKTIIRKVGMGPIQRDGMEYEFTLFFELTQTHYAEATKDRTGLFDGQIIQITPETGKILKDWLESGSESKPIPVATANEPAPVTAPTTTTQQYKPLSQAQIKRFYAIVSQSGATADVAKIITEDVLKGKQCISPVDGKIMWDNVTREDYDRLCNMFESGEWQQYFQKILDADSEPVALDLDEVI